MAALVAPTTLNTAIDLMSRRWVLLAGWNSSALIKLSVVGYGIRSDSEQDACCPPLKTLIMPNHATTDSNVRSLRSKTGSAPGIFFDQLRDDMDRVAHFTYVIVHLNFNHPFHPPPLTPPTPLWTFESREVKMTPPNEDQQRYRSLTLACRRMVRIMPSEVPLASATNALRAVLSNTDVLEKETSWQTFERRTEKVFAPTAFGCEGAKNCIERGKLGITVALDFFDKFAKKELRWKSAADIVQRVHD
ncbi:hypothetical protein SISNIDRAFT_487210 [Sistotremastrum niveocremeum HHB9708]|uniref:Uncharacterized protein n=1 Tax=Sistotremastrum niveocremeum HHB9708 TaxID=1314777 RepID=A0A164SJA7_9AGAM|nr:hypothetical protein SISNIDRAFT_487210 [Sistotremastrum niveocremeum HHB9708]